MAINRDRNRNEIINRLASKAGLRGKIDAFCCHCIYDPYSDGTWRKQVENCTALSCPLYSVRPVSNYVEEI
nr:hypothetical protein 3 [Gammaproteobacteria bacterium]